MLAPLFSISIVPAKMAVLVSLATFVIESADPPRLLTE